MQLTRILHNCTTTLWIWCICSLSAATVSAQLTFARGCPYSEACADHQLPHLALPTPCLHPWACMSHIMENPWKSATREANAKPIKDMIFQKVRLILRPNKSLSQAPVSRSNVKSCSFGMLIKKCSTLLFWFRIIFFRSKHLKDFDNFNMLMKKISKNTTEKSEMNRAGYSHVLSKFLHARNGKHHQEQSRRAALAAAFGHHKGQEASHSQRKSQIQHDRKSKWF